MNKRSDTAGKTYDSHSSRNASLCPNEAKSVFLDTARSTERSPASHSLTGCCEIWVLQVGVRCHMCEHKQEAIVCQWENAPPPQPPGPWKMVPRGRWWRRPLMSHFSPSCGSKLYTEATCRKKKTFRLSSGQFIPAAWTQRRTPCDAISTKTLPATPHGGRERQSKPAGDKLFSRLIASRHTRGGQINWRAASVPEYRSSV